MTDTPAAEAPGTDAPAAEAPGTQAPGTGSAPDGLLTLPEVAERLGTDVVTPTR